MTIRLLFVPRINFQTVADRLNSVEQVTPKTNRITPQIPCSFALSSPPLELLRSSQGGGREAKCLGAQLNFLRFYKHKQTQITSVVTDIRVDVAVDSEFCIFFNNPVTQRSVRIWVH